MVFFVQFSLLVIAIVSGCQAQCETKSSANFCDQLEHRLTLLESKMLELSDKVNRDSKDNNHTTKLNSELGESNQPRLNNLEAKVTELTDQLADLNRKQTNATEAADLSPISCHQSECRKVTVLGRTFEVLYENNNYGHDWIVFQNRYDGSVSFNRNWADYRNGFGSMDGEFWLGLEHIHWLTSSKNYELLVLLEDYRGLKKYARYDKLVIGGEWEGYNLKTLGSYHGTAPNGLDLHRNQKFSTFDRDHDAAPSSSCALGLTGGWWFKDCGYSNLNGLHQNVIDKTVITFSNFADGSVFKITRMMIRAV